MNIITVFYLCIKERLSYCPDQCQFELSAETVHGRKNFLKAPVIIYELGKPDELYFACFRR